MFTGIVTDIGDVVAIDDRAQGLRRLTIACAYDPASIAIGASICCSGVCMTAVATGKNTFSVDAAAETLQGDDGRPLADRNAHQSRALAQDGR